MGQLLAIAFLVLYLVGAILGREVLRRAGTDRLGD